MRDFHPFMSHLRILRVLTPWLLLCALCYALGGVANAHPANVAGGRAKIASDGKFVMQARFDLLAYIVGQTPLRVADGPMNALLDGPPDALQKALKTAEAKFARETALKADNGAGTIDSIKFPTLAQVQDWRDNGLPPRLPVMLITEIKGHFPPGAKTISFGFPPVLGSFVFTEEVENQEPFTEGLDDGAFSTPFPLLTGFPAPTPQKPGESPAALYKPKKKTAAQTPKQTTAKTAATKPPIARANAQNAPLKPKVASAKPAPKSVAKPQATPRPKPATVAPLAPQKPASGSGTASAMKPQLRSPIAPPIAANSPALGSNKVPASPKNANANALKPAPLADAKATAGATENSVPSVTATEAPAEAPVEAPIVRAQATSPTWFALFGNFIERGYFHILPGGLDHILFVLGLFLLGTKLPALLKQITAFTVAHSLTLALAASGMVKVPAAIVEPLIALSIVFVAIENLSTTEVRPWRIMVIFAFGLVHGLGFAEVFENLGLTGSNFLTALLGFNIGVELGQLTVVALALLTVGWFRKREGYRKFVVVPASLAIAAVAAIWALQRVFLV